MKFDLMKEKPDLDIPTLNFIWDYLWRKNAVNNRKNDEQRSRAKEQEQIMEIIQWFANNEISIP